ncbi:hypothetical protein SGMN_38370 [Stenotrophomonas geniculata]
MTDICIGNMLDQSFGHKRVGALIREEQDTGLLPLLRRLDIVLQLGDHVQPTKTRHFELRPGVSPQRINLQGYPTALRRHANLPLQYKVAVFVE